MDINQDGIFQKKSRVAPLFDHKMNEEMLEDLKVEPADKKPHVVVLFPGKNLNSWACGPYSWCGRFG